MSVHSDVVEQMESRGPADMDGVIQALVHAMINQTVEIQRLIETVRESRPRNGNGFAGVASMEQAVSDYERTLIEGALGTTRGNRTQAARLLHITPRIINYKIRKYSIDCSRFR